MANKLEKICYDQSLKRQFLISLNKRQVLDLDTVINFVENNNKNRKNITSNVMKTSFKMAKDLKMNAVWLTYDQAISLINKNTRNVFVIDNFKSDIFDLLRKNYNNLVFGPECIYFCKSSLLPIKNFPVLNLSMWNLDICLDDNLENKLEYFVGLVNLMGGAISKKLRPSTTHLISKNFYSEKAKNARLYGIPIMTEGWIEKCWDLSLHQSSFADEDKKTFKKYRLPVFHKIFVTVSQIEFETKKKIQELVTTNGGKFSGELNDEFVTHLILTDPKGNKYEHAKNKEKIKIVTPEWIYDSIKSEYPLIEDKYSFKKSDFIQKFDFSQQSDFSQLSQFSILSSQQDKTKLSRNLSQISITFCSENSQSNKNEDSSLMNEQKESLQQRSAFSMLTSFNQNKQKSLSIEDKFKKLTETLKPNNIFDGCDFYLVDESQTNVKSNLLKKCISSQNGFFSSNLRESVTHVIINSQLTDSKLKELDKKIAELDFSVNKVDLEWVYNCLKANKQLPIINVVNSSQKSQSQSHKNHPKFTSSTLSIKSNFPTSSTQINNSASKNKVFSIQSTREKIFSQEEDNIDDYFSKEFNTNNTSNNFELINEKPLKGCVLTFSLYEDKIKEELKKIAVNLGAVFQDSFYKTDKPAKSIKRNTHLICDEASGKKFCKSKEWGIFCCTQEWLRKCEQHKKRLDEKDFSPESKNSIEQNNKKVFKSNIENIRNHIAINSVPYSSQVNLFIDSSNSPSVVSESSQETQKTNPNVNSVSEVSIQSKLENLKTLMSSNDLNRFIEQDNSIFSNLNHKIDILNTNSSLINNKQLDHSIPIAWNDLQSNCNSLEGNLTSSLPDEFRNDLSIKNNQYHNDSYYAKSINDSSILVRNNLNKQNNKSFEIYQDTLSIKTNSILKISFNYSSEKNLADISKKLESLNIKVVKNEYDFSHLVIDESKVFRNEAFFISLSSGKYIVHKSFVEKIVNTGIIPKSEEYEWSNDEIAKLFSKDVMPLIKAYKFWKNNFEKTGKMAFENQEIILISPKAKSFVNVIQSSGGKVMSIALNEKTSEAYECALKETIKKFNEKEYINIDYILIDILEEEIINFDKFKKNSNSIGIFDLISKLEKMKIKCYYISFLKKHLYQPESTNTSDHRICKFLEKKNLKRTRNEEIDESTYSKLAKTN